VAPERPEVSDKRTVVQAGGRAKAYRPLPPAERRSALARGLEAYGRGDFFLAHELLEPAWMGTDDLAERALLQGLIKLAAAFVHAARGNPRGVAKNLRGAHDHLRQPGAGAAGAAVGVDAERLLDRIAERLVAADRWVSGADEPAAVAIRIPRPAASPVPGEGRKPG
jgi:predicted metal-dependent hydrolase